MAEGTTEIVEAADPQPIETPAEGNWIAGLPENLRTDPAIRDFKSVDDLATSYVNTKKMLGTRVPIPAHDDPDATREFFSKMGVPEKPDGYEVRPDGLPQDFTPDPKILSTFQEAAHKLNLTPRQFQGLVQYNARLSEQIQKEQALAAEQTIEAKHKALDDAFGPAKGEQGQLAASCINRFGDDGVLQKLNDAGLGLDPDIIKMLAKIEKSCQSDPMLTGSQESQYTITKSEAERDLEMMKNDPETVQAMVNPSHPRHAEVESKMNKLYTQIHGAGTIALG